MFGLIRVGAAVPKLCLADCPYNRSEIIELINLANAEKIKVLVFPELCITGFSNGDLFYQQTLLKSAERALTEIVETTADMDMLIAVGMPVACGNQIFNAVVLLNKGVILGAVPKAYLTNERQFASAFDCDIDYAVLSGQCVPFGTDLIFRCTDNRELAVAVEVGTDFSVPLPAAAYMALNGATLIVNPIAEGETVTGYEKYKKSAESHSAACIAAYVGASAGIYESTQDMVFAGSALIAENGCVMAECERFALENRLIAADIDVELLTTKRRTKPAFVHKTELPPMREVYFTLAESDDDNILRNICRNPFAPVKGEALAKRTKEIFTIQYTGLARRMMHTHSKSAVVGISGGLDSTLALLVTVKAFDFLGLERKNIVGVTMPGFGTTDRTYNNALDLMKSLDITIKEISIVPSIKQHFVDIKHDMDNHNVVYENAQARERTQILMDIANEIGGLAVGTGDLSELALGWATYNGDHMSMYGVNASVPKTVVQMVVDWVGKNGGLGEKTAEILQDVLDTPISPELLPPSADGNIKQKTEDIVGPYELHDFFLYYIVHCNFEPSKIFAYAKKAWAGIYDDETLLKWLKNFYRRFFAQQFKRSCLPDGPMVGTVCLSPRGAWQMPSDGSGVIWLNEVEKLG